MDFTLQTLLTYHKYWCYFHYQILLIVSIMFFCVIRYLFCLNFKIIYIKIKKYIKFESYLSVKKKWHYLYYNNELFHLQLNN